MKPYAPTCPTLVDSFLTPTQIVELDRGRLLRNEQRAVEAKHAGEPLRNVSCQADAAGQIGFGLPMQDNVTHGTDRYVWTVRGGPFHDMLATM